MSERVQAEARGVSVGIDTAEQWSFQVRSDNGVITWTNDATSDVRNFDRFVAVKQLELLAELAESAKRSEALLREIADSVRKPLKVG